MRLPSFLRMYLKLEHKNSILQESNEMKAIHLSQLGKEYVHLIMWGFRIVGSLVFHVRL